MCLCGKAEAGLSLVDQGTCQWCGHDANGWPSLSDMWSRVQSSLAHVVPSGPPAVAVSARRARSGWTVEACVRAARQWEREKGKLPTSSDWQLAMNGFHRPSYAVVRVLFGGWPQFMSQVRVEAQA